MLILPRTALHLNDLFSEIHRFAHYHALMKLWHNYSTDDTEVGSAESELTTLLLLVQVRLREHYCQLTAKCMLYSESENVSEL